MNGERKFVVLMVDGEPSKITLWSDWVNLPVGDRPLNGYIVEAVDELQAYIKAQQGEIK